MQITPQLTRQALTHPTARESPVA